MPGTGALLSEVREFLTGLRQELPDLFQPPPPPRPRPVRKIAADNTAALRERAKEVLAERVAHWSSRMDTSHGGITIRDQKTLWGSCSRRGDLSFNCRLLLAPPEVLDYVVIHELCHRIEMNHSPRFWELVSRWCPQQRARRRWLRKEGRHIIQDHALPDLHRSCGF